MSTVRILICGGRDFHDYQRVEADLLRLTEGYSDIVLITGMAKGADSLALKIHENYECTLDKYPADWNTYGKRAGFIRNEQMLVQGKPDIVLAYWDGSSKGTKHMIDLVKKTNVTLFVERY